MYLSNKDAKKYAEMFLEMFKEEIPKVWTNSEILDDTIMECVVSTRMTRALAKVGIHQLENPNSVGRTLLVKIPRLKLTVSSQLLEMSEEKILAVIIHEVIHLGNWNHGRQFKSMCHKFGGSLNGRLPGEKRPEITAVKIQVQLKKGARFQTVEIVGSVSEARKIAREKYLRSFKYSKVRIRY